MSLDKNIFVSYLMPQTPSSNFLFTFNLNTVFKRTRKNIYLLYCVLGAGSRVESFFFQDKTCLGCRGKLRQDYDYDLRAHFILLLRVNSRLQAPDVKVIDGKLYPLVYTGLKELNQLRYPLDNDLSRGLSH